MIIHVRISITYIVFKHYMTLAHMKSPRRHIRAGLVLTATAISGLQQPRPPGGGGGGHNKSRAVHAKSLSTEFTPNGSGPWCTWKKYDSCLPVRQPLLATNTAPAKLAKPTRENLLKGVTTSAQLTIPRLFKLGGAVCWPRASLKP